MRHMSDWQVPQRVPAIGIDIVGWLATATSFTSCLRCERSECEEDLQEIEVQTLPGRDESQGRF